MTYSETLSYTSAAPLEQYETGSLERRYLDAHRADFEQWEDELMATELANNSESSPSIKAAQTAGNLALAAIDDSNTLTLTDEATIQEEGLDFELEAIQPDTPSAFPEPSEEASDPDGQVNKILNWALSNTGCHLDAIRDKISNNEQAAEWLRLKVTIASYKRDGFSMNKWDEVIAIERDADKLVQGTGGGTVYKDA